MTKSVEVLKFDADPKSKQSLRFWLRLLGCTEGIEKQIRAKLVAEYGITLPQFDILAALDRIPQGLTMSQLSEYLLISNGNTTVVVNRLVEAKLVTRTRKGDRRMFKVQLTPQGITLFKQMAQSHEAWVEHILSDVSYADLKALTNGLAKAAESIIKNPI